MTLRPQSASVDIDDLIANAGGGIPEEVSQPAPRKERKPRTEDRSRRDVPKRAPKRVGRPPKDKADKRNQKVAIALTEAERNKLKEKAGMIPEASYLLSILRDAGVFD
ncbi:MAG: hypothetical protein AAGI28_11860 [Pseudomonadota bacterium]